MHINPSQSGPSQGPNDGNNIGLQLETISSGYENLCDLWSSRPSFFDTLLVHLTHDEFHRAHLNFICRRHDMSPLNGSEVLGIISHFGGQWEGQKNVAYPTCHMILRGERYVCTIHTPYSSREDLVHSLALLQKQ